MGSGYVRESPDGELELIAEVELFDDETPPVSGDGRDMVVRRAPAGLTVHYDWTHRSAEDQTDIAAIAQAFGTKPAYEGKKAVEPLSVITVVGAFVLGSFAHGFFEEIGADAWKLVKDRLSALMSRKKEAGTAEQLLRFSILLEAASNRVEVDIILTNPSYDDLDWTIDAGIAIVESVLPDYLADAPYVRRLVFEVHNKSVVLKFAVRSDCRPLTPTVSVEEILRSHREERSDGSE